MKDYERLKTVPARNGCLKVSFFFFTTCVLVWFSINFITSLGSSKAVEPMMVELGNEERRQIVEDLHNEEKTEKNEETTMKLNNNSAQPVILDINEIKRRIALINRKEKIVNEEKYGPVGNDSLVVVVQVHNRISYLKYLIASLRVAKGISDVLLVFSHDFYDEEINALIRTIDFCKYIEIFYPYSLQIYPHDFPGDDPNDCPPEISKYEALRSLCTNALTPDHDGKYRKPATIQIKHHWWWKANRAFDLAVLKKYNGLILFLEDDLYVVEDFIPTLRLMEKAVITSCDYCKILSLAQNDDAVHISEGVKFRNPQGATVTSQFSNMGLAFNRATWNEMVDCRQEFCNYDDYNWDFSLQHVFTTCMGKTAAMTLSSPRVYHIGTCGTHFKSNDCDPSTTVKKVRTILTKAKDNLYPKSLNLLYMLSFGKITRGYGGWGDTRDHALCLGMTIK